MTARRLPAAWRRDSLPPTGPLDGTKNRMRGRHFVRFALLAAVGLGLSGCAAIPGITVNGGRQQPWYSKGIPKKDQKKFAPEVVPVTPKLIRKQAEQREQDRAAATSQKTRQAVASYVYHVEPQDVLNVVVWGHPELSNPMGNFQNIVLQGRLVRQDGTIYFPYAGVVHVAGLTVEQIRRKLTQDLVPYIKSPQLDVRVVSYKSQKVYVTGQVNKPGIEYLDDSPLTIMDAINQAGGFAKDADKREAILTTPNGKQHDINILALYSEGRGNRLLHAGDVLYVPDNSQNKVFVMGEVNEQTAVPMDKGRLTLAEAISDAKGIDFKSANTRGVFVIRGVPKQGPNGKPHIVPRIFALDAHNASALLLASEFRLQPHDVVLVSTAGLANFNRVISQVLPTIQSLYELDILHRNL